MRRLIAIVLLTIFGLPFAHSLFALTPENEANLPACCRHNGKHHCAMSMAQQGQMPDSTPGVRAKPETCPYMPLAMTGAHHPVDSMPFSPGQLIYAELVSHPAHTAQTECKFRIARDRARGKRGPPSFLNS